MTNKYYGLVKIRTKSEKKVGEQSKSLWDSLIFEIPKIFRLYILYVTLHIAYLKFQLPFFSYFLDLFEVCTKKLQFAYWDLNTRKIKFGSKN